MAHTDSEGVDMLLRKGVYPYDYIGSAARLQEDRLPERYYFFNRLQNRESSEEYYAPAQIKKEKNVECETLKDYHDLYLKCDVLLLVDVFEAFRTVSLSTFGLDASYYASSPQLSWGCMTKNDWV
jgi:hypothetical protein